MTNPLSYAGKRVVIAGCFSGMGEACARALVDLGAEVHGVDIRPSPVSMASFTELDLKDWAAIDHVVAAIGGEVDGVFNCAGLPQTFPAADVVAVNFLGIRHWSEQWMPRMKRGAAIVSVSSNAAMGYMQRVPLLREFIATTDKAAALDWVAAHADDVADGYGFSKEALAVWTQMRSVDLIAEGKRINCTFPSPTATPMMKDFEKIAPKMVFDFFAKPINRQATPEEQAWPLILLNSPAASFISGVCLPVDAGFTGGVLTGEIDMAAFRASLSGGQ
ncbi:MAG: SDR family oxidoreductase [Sphingomonadaceae bacterium]|nr:SDR family oxidoreductase [Sphingomonadaceae bacterium]